jgi:hypothetical protein
MDEYAQKLLDRQLRGIVPPRHDGVIILSIVAVFIAGMALGSALFAQKSEPMQIASYSLVNGALLTTQ